MASLNHSISLKCLSSSNCFNTSLPERSALQHEAPGPPRSQAVGWAVGTSLICAIGCLGNILALIATWPTSSGARGFNVLIFHFTWTNLYACLVMLFNVVLLLIYPFGHDKEVYVCSVLFPIQFMGPYLINWADAGLALNRFIALFFPFSYKDWTSRTASFSLIAFAWVASVASIFPILYGVGGAFSLTPAGLCLFAAKSHEISEVQTGLYYVPCAISGIGALLILWKTYTTRNLRISENGSEADKRHYKNIMRRIKMAKMLLFTFLWSVVCTLPFALIVFNFPWVLRRDAMTIMWLRLVMTSQPAFSPAILLLHNKEYRSSLAKVFGGLRWSRKFSVKPLDMGAGSNGQDSTSRRRSRRPSEWSQPTSHQQLNTQN